MEYRFRLHPNVNPFIKILVFLVIIILSWGMALSSLTSSLPLFFGISNPMAFMQSISTQSNAGAILYVLAINSIGLFLLPPHIFFLIFNINAVSFLRLGRFPPLKFWLLGIIIMFASGAFIELLAQLQSLIPLPAKLAWLRQDNKVLEDMIDTLFKIPGIGGLMLVTFIVAFLPALAEEIFFRGLIQNYLAKTNLGNTGAIIITGLCFSLMHGEFDNLLAIWVMGMVLGMLYYYSGNLWVNITAHFLNNFTIVAAKFAYHSHLLHSDVAATSTDTLPLYITLPAGAVMVVGLIVMKNLHRREVKSEAITL